MMIEIVNPTSELLPDGSYLTEYESLRVKVEKLTEKWCSVRSQERLAIVQVPGLSKRLLSQEISFNHQESLINRIYRSSKSFVSPHVYYPTSELEQLYSAKCLEEGRMSEVRIPKWEDTSFAYESFLKDLHSNVFFLQLPSQGTLTDEDYLKALRNALDHLKCSMKKVSENNISFIIQGLPSEPQNSFRSRELPTSNSTIGSGSAMDKYTFFTPGIWMTTIVSLFLAWVFSVALNWVSSLQISYKAFEKQVNPQKKTQ
ncbi:V0 sector of the vacuolar ATPase assembly protein 1 [Komagataella phaffii CBS 7435]|nr:V0 sector of the vacuolar ATPase assembly protein 1 [Komagataella phaffii CBS 7435]CCA36874.1 V0 sector of the vacuolar ATPase assembly protein 1 [Komagataella phaffii CBS 7435]